LAKVIAGEPDHLLLEACERGESEAFARLFEGYKDRVYAVALRLSGDPVEAADLTQEVFLKLLTRVHQFRSEARFGTWLYRVVVNTFLDGRKARRPSVPLEEATLGMAGVQPPQQEEAAAQAALVRAVERSLARLDGAFRAPLVLRYVGGLSYAEIAEALQLSPGTVASRISRGLRDLGRELSPLKRA
jgi:RNA polymerase sigma-70 factor, ECF subfamily